MKTADEFYQDIEPLIQNGWYSAAIDALEQLMKIKPDFGRGYYELGTLHYKHGDKGKVLECYKKCHELDPRNVDYLKSLADFYHAGLEQVESALGVYEKIIDIDDTDVDSLFIAANLNVVLHEFDKAGMYYQKVLEVQPWHTEAADYLEKIKAHQASLAETLTPEKLYQKSQTASGAGDIPTAISILERLVLQYPDYAIAHNDLGVYYQKIGEIGKAEQSYSAALRLEPFNNTFEKNYADFQFAIIGNVNEALKHYLNVLKRNPEDTEVLMAAGHVCTGIDRHEDAQLFFRRVLEIEPWSLETSENLEELQREMTQKRAAGLN
jgi:tetratricopeptide (TPR) repeat protein